MKAETIEYLSEGTGIPRREVARMLWDQDGRGKGRRPGFDADPRYQEALFESPRTLPVVFPAGLSPYDDFMLRRASGPGGAGGCLHVRGLLMPVLAVIDEWRSAAPDSRERPTCDRCGRRGRAPVCSQCARL